MGLRAGLFPDDFVARFCDLDLDLFVGGGICRFLCCVEHVSTLFAMRRMKLHAGADMVRACQQSTCL